MPERRDPVAEATNDDDLYGIATWEPRSLLDRLAVLLYRGLVFGARGLVVLVGVVLFFAIGGFSAVTDPRVGLLTVLSAVPALALAGYVYLTDVTEAEPLDLLVATFLLSVLTATFAAVLNGVAEGVLGFGARGGLVTSTLFFFLVVGPVEETVKLLAVRLYAYRAQRFSAVVDGAVYGAVAGLGFAFIENALYITRQVDGAVAEAEFGVALIGAGGGITAIRALAGPGHVIYSAVAGYYLGLAKFNPDYRGPLVIKGLLLAAAIHGLYNSTVGIGSALVQAATGLSSLAAFLTFVVVFDGAFGLLILNKVRRYNGAFRTAPDDTASADDDGEAAVPDDVSLREDTDERS
ncbi:MAG: putative membrane protein [uncultured archaeon A07HB70]|nr:MAG: putative membrane protein [uncultured archaeon A07HB70]